MKKLWLFGLVFSLISLFAYSQLPSALQGKVIRVDTGVPPALTHITIKPLGRPPLPKIDCRGPSPACPACQGTFVINSLLSGPYVIDALARESDGSLWTAHQDVDIDSGTLSDLGNLALTKRTADGRPQTSIRGLTLTLSRVPASPITPVFIASTSVAGMSRLPVPQSPVVSGAVQSSEDENAVIDGEIVITDTTSGDTVKTVPILHSSSGRAEPPNSSRSRRTNTFDLGILAEGEYLFSISARNYRSRLLVLRVGAGNFDFIDTDGQPASVILMQPEAELSSLYRPRRQNPVTRQNFTGTQRFDFKGAIIEALPLGGVRRLDSLALLLPGIVAAPEAFTPTGPSVGPTLGEAGEYSTNGMRPRQNSFTVDGADNNDEVVGTRRQGYVVSLAQPIESVSELQIMTLLPDARFGRVLGGQVNINSKYGQSAFHGEGFALWTGTPLIARDPFDGLANAYPSSMNTWIPITSNGRLDGTPVRLDLGNTAVPGLVAQNGFAYTPNPRGGREPYRRGQAGFVIGGPILRDQTFFFGSYERQRVRATQETHFAVPTVAQRGIFDKGATGLSGLPSIASGNSSYPATLLGNATLSLFPFPNDPLGPYGVNTFTENLPSDASAQIFSFKVDHRVRGTTVAGRYNLSDENSIIPETGAALFSSIRPRVRMQNIVLTAVGNLWPAITNATRFSYGRTARIFEEARDPNLMAPTRFGDYPFLLNRPLLLNLTMPQDTSPYYAAGLAPAAMRFWQSAGIEALESTDGIHGPLGQVALGGFSPIGLDTFRFPQRPVQNTYHISEIVTWLNRRNALSVGIDAERLQLNGSIQSGIRPRAEYGMLRPLAQEDLGKPSCGIFGCSSEDTAQPVGPAVFSAATMAAAGIPSSVLQTLSFHTDYTTRVRRWQTDMFGQWDRQIRSNFQISLGGRINNNRLPKAFTEGALSAYDYDRLTQQADAALKNPACDPRCRALVNGLKAVFPSDFKNTFGHDRYGFDGRLGWAWSPTRIPTMVLRGGFGVFTGTFPMIVITEGRSLFPEFVPLNLSTAPSEIGRSPYNSEGLITSLLNPGTLSVLKPLADNSNPVTFLAEQLGSLRPTLFFSRPVSQLDNPYGYHYSLTVEQQLNTEISVLVSYAGTQGRKLLRVNTPAGGPNRTKLDYEGISVGAGGLPRPNWTLYLPQEQITVTPSSLPVPVVQFEGTGNSSYNSLQMELRKAYGRRIIGDVGFTWSHAIDDVSDFFDLAGAYALPQNSLHRSERASASFDSRLRFVSHLVWDLPGQLSRHRYVGGWQIASIFVAQSGQPFTVNTAVDANLDGNLTDRPMNVGLRPVQSTDRQTRLTLDVDPQLMLASPGQDGSLGRNTFTGDPLRSWDLAITKVVAAEPAKITARVEVFNVTNRVHFGIPVRILEFPSFGRSVSAASSPRTLQISLKVSF
jgi:hypothetical protein